MTKLIDFILLPFVSLILWLGDKVELIRQIETEREGD